MNCELTWRRAGIGAIVLLTLGATANYLPRDPAPQKKEAKPEIVVQAVPQRLWVDEAFNGLTPDEAIYFKALEEWETTNGIKPGKESEEGPFQMKKETWNWACDLAGLDPESDEWFFESNVYNRWKCIKLLNVIYAASGAKTWDEKARCHRYPCGWRTRMKETDQRAECILNLMEKYGWERK